MKLKIVVNQTYFITDRLPSYNEAAATVLSNTKHVPVAPILVIQIITQYIYLSFTIILLDHMAH